MGMWDFTRNFTRERLKLLQEMTKWQLEFSWRTTMELYAMAYDL